MTTSSVFYHPTRAHEAERQLRPGDRVRDDHPAARFDPDAPNYPGANRYATVLSVEPGGRVAVLRWDDDLVCSFPTKDFTRL